MMTTFTPAPWRLGPGHDGMDAILGADNTWVCRIFVGDGDGADASLIVAAPAMHAAATPLVAEIAHYPPSAGEDDDELVSVRLGDLKALRRAVALADPASSDPAGGTP